MIMKRFFSAFAGVLLSLSGAYGATSAWDAVRDAIKDAPGEIGVALITSEGDTVAVNNECKYPMMSVFKLHQAVALCRADVPLDSVVVMARTELNPDTWSPMLRDHAEDTLRVSVRELMRYTLMQSDNNASNVMFDRLLGVEATDSVIATIIPRDGFRIVYREADMGEEHARAYANRTSPLSAACLMYRLFADSLMAENRQEFLRATLLDCRTGTDRIAAPLADVDGLSPAHKTGSGFRDGDVLSACNDVAFIRLPDGRGYALAVFVKDFRGDEAQASRVIAGVSAAVYKHLMKNIGEKD